MHYAMRSIGVHSVDSDSLQKAQQTGLCYSHKHY